MEFLDKLTNMARTAAEKTATTAGGAVEMGRVSLRKAGENAAIASLLEDLGSYFYDKYEAGMEMEGDALELCQALRARYETIAELEAKGGLLKKQLMGPVEGVKQATRTAARKAEDVARKAGDAARKAGDIVADFVDDDDDDEAYICPHCGATLRHGDDFCPKCGRRADEE